MGHLGKFKIAWMVGIIVLSVVSFSLSTEAKMGIEKQPFGKTPDGTPVDLYTLTNDNGMVVKITNYGGTVTSLIVPDRNGKMGDVVLGYDNLDGYLKNNPYFGCIIGRYANRIAKGRFVLNGVEYKLAQNNGENHLHGGIKGFDKVVWNAKEVKAGNGVGVELSYLSKDGEEGYPGNLSVTVTYVLTNNNELKINYLATTDKDTVVNLTHHSYFNLAGAGEGDILGHELMINADKFTPVDKTLIPTGELRSVKGTPMDFTQSTAIGARINQEDEQLIFGKGYDHNWVLNIVEGALTRVARVYEPKTGRVMEVFTTEPGMQFYTGNFLDGTITGKGGKVYYQRYGFCLETQHFPDSPNKPQFPSTVLKPGQTYRTTTVYQFSTK
ncbi:MAG TPA: aldose epimerase family protein [Candidatus Limnocylindrales bacterium]|nr:aldose epimerase family protein [Candidatus Limnocylindrales bacterium]